MLRTHFIHGFQIFHVGPISYSMTNRGNISDLPKGLSSIHNKRKVIHIYMEQILIPIIFGH